MKRIYIAGPMRGFYFFNFAAFDFASTWLKEQGWFPVSPADLDRDVGFNPRELPEDFNWTQTPKGFDMQAAIRRDLAAIMTCQAIYMLDGWENSKGARAEKALAEWLGLEVLYETEPKDEDILEEALRITRGDRQAQYGPPDQDFQRTAAMWSALKGVEFEARDVAMFMVCLKLSREVHQRKRDNAVDIAGYARCLSLCQ